MKCLKLLSLAVILLSGSTAAYALAPAAQSNPPANSSSESADQYPMFDSKDAQTLWHMKVVSANFTQDEYGRVLDLCIVAYDYLNGEITRIIDETTSPSVRKKRALDLDMGKTSQMANFVRGFTNYMQNLAAEGKFDHDNLVKINRVIKQKKEFNRLNDELYHSTAVATAETRSY